MSMPLSDIASAHPLRRSGQIPIPGRIGALAVTALAHLVVIAALIAGLEQARIIHPPEITVQFSLEKRKVVTPPPAAPQAPSVIDAAAPVMAPPVISLAPAPGPASAPLMLPSPPDARPGSSNARPTWETALLNRLAEARHTPAPAARGVVLLRFTMDRNGKVLGAAIEKSSGNDALDQEALAALQRAQPLPLPPAEIPGDTLDLIVPVDFL